MHAFPSQCTYTFQSAVSKWMGQGKVEGQTNIDQVRKSWNALCSDYYEEVIDIYILVFKGVLKCGAGEEWKISVGLIM